MKRSPSDFRSDTLTRPTPAMREAMATAEVGDDVFGEDPTVQRLEAAAAARLGMEAGLFVPTGTMANQIGVKLFTRPGDEIIAEADSHVLTYEVGGIGALSGVQSRAIKGRDGAMDAGDVEAAIRGEDIHLPRTALICVEQTHNVAGGVPVPLESLERLREVSLRRGVPILMDGARLFNAAVADRVDPREYVRRVDLAWFALSKGLSCPVGSVMVGSKERIVQCRRIRKLFGGGMRQVGVLAACGLIALETGIDRLAEDHARARRLGQRIERLRGVRVDLEHNRTNILMVHFSEPRADAIEAELAGRGVLALALKPKLLRFVTHREVGDDDVERAAEAMEAVLA